MKWDSRIEDNTFGFELEFGDADKTKIHLRKGYAWTDNDLARMHNSDGSAVSHTGNFGGEINTRPYGWNQKDLDECRDFIQEIKDAGGYLMWNEGFDAHFYIKNLELDVIKRIFELSYWVAPHIKKIFHLAEWFENKYIAPSPTYDYVRKLNAVNSIEEIPAVFANSSHRGNIRFYINLVPITKIGTAEFRIFNSSWVWEETLETIKFMYSFVQYALQNENVDEYKNLNSVEKCLKAFNIEADLIPRPHKPLLWANEHTDHTSLIGQSFNKTKSMMTKISKAVEPYEVVHVVNSHYMDLEQALTKPMVVYTKSLYIYLFYKIIFEDYKFTLESPFDFIKMDEGDKAERVAKLFMFAEIKKYRTDNFYHTLKFNDYKDKFDYYLGKQVHIASAIVNRLSGKKIEVVKGDILDCLGRINPDTEVLVYQSEFHQSIKSVSNLLKSYGKIEWEDTKTKYSEVDITKVPYVVVTKNALMGLPKIYRNSRMFLYSNVGEKPINKFEGRTIVPVYYKKLPSNYQITENSELKFIRAKMSEIDYLRMQYMKKDIMLGSAVFNYLWFLDDYLIGVTMFDFSKQSTYGGDKVWMKSDFVIDSDFDKLSKLLIMGVLSEEFKEELDIKYKTKVGIITTTVFTNNPVSMKYRGVFDLDKREHGKLYYDQYAGHLGPMRQVVKTFIEKHRKTKK